VEPEGSSPRLQELTTVPVLSLINPVHFPFPFLEKHFTTILKSTPKSCKVSPLGFPNQNIERTSHLIPIHTMYPTHVILLYLISRIMFSEKHR